MLVAASQGTSVFASSDYLSNTKVQCPSCKKKSSLTSERTHKKGVAEQRNFLCEGGCPLANATAVAYTRAYEYRHSGTIVSILCDSTVLVD
eukprot:COSAG05_NODE_1264_length_5336_cov_17.508497_4_plen_91_part_00